MGRPPNGLVCLRREGPLHQRPVFQLCSLQHRRPPHGCQVTVNVTLSTGLEPSGVEITLKGLEYPYETYFDVTPASGTVVFDFVWKGHYDLTAIKIGYDTYVISNTFINADKTYNIVLSEKKYAPTCLVVDPLTLEATWCEPLRHRYRRDLRRCRLPAGRLAELPPMVKAGSGPMMAAAHHGRSRHGTASMHVSNDDGAGSTNPGDADYLITPPVDLRESEGYALTFNSYYDGAFGQLAFVEYTLDGGATWEVLAQMSPSSSWADIAD